MSNNLKSHTKALVSTAGHNGAVEKLIDLSKIWAIIKKNWLVLKSDKIRLFPLFMFPVLMIVIFGYVSGNIPKHLPTAIVDYDHSQLSQSVQDDLSGMEYYSVIRLVGTQDEGKKLMDQGKIKVLFVIPAGFQDSVASGQPAQINLMVDESDPSVAQAATAAARTYASQLSEGITNQRLDIISMKADAASYGLQKAKAALALPLSSSTDAAASSSFALMRDSSLTYSASNNMVSATVQSVKNSLGYLVDQNEVISGYGPSSLATATLTLLATGDSQQQSLQQIAVYGALGAYSSRIMQNGQKIYANLQSMAGQSNANKKSAQISAALIDSASTQMSSLSSDAQLASSQVSISILEPYGYGRRGIDFLLPSILATIIFQGASMGLGRAIAGEKKDGSLTRVFLTPTSNVTIILGTQLFYLLLEVVRSSFIILVAIALFGVTISGNLLDIVAIIAIYSIGATGVGMVLSVITNSQEQYMAVGMLISMPIMFLSGVFFPVQTMPKIFQSVAGILPVTYAADALRGVMVKGFPLDLLMPDIISLTIFGAITFTLTVLLFKRELA